MRPVHRMALAASVVAICGAYLPGALWGQSFVTCGSSICASPSGTNVFIGGASSYVQVPHINGATGLLFDTGDDAYAITFGASYMTIMPNGTVGIGTANPNPSYKLSVIGIIHANEVVVDTATSDYVFAPDYRLAPLREVAAYIQEHRHLPEIPSEKEVEEKGVSLGEMQAKLLAKVEELTLHLIQAEARSDKLEQQNRELQEKFARFEKVFGDDFAKADRKSAARPLQ